MQLIYLLWLAILNNIFVFAESSLDSIDAPELDDALDNDVTSNGRKYVNLNVTYTIREKPDANFTDILEFAPEEFLTLNYNLFNGEDDAVNIVGVSGNVYTLPDGYFAANISESAIDPINVSFNESTNFQQEVRLVLDEGKYFVEPIVIVEKEGEVMRVAAQAVMVEIVPPPMSFFNIQFLSIQLTFVAILGATYYYNVNRVTKSFKKSKNVKPVKVDESWLPDNYKKK